MEDEKLIEVGELSQNMNRISGSSLPPLKIYRSKGLPAHLLKKRHFDSLKYIDHIPLILEAPDYMGVNPNESGETIEYIKKIGKTILVGVKIAPSRDYLYVASMYTLQESKLERRLHSGRIKKYIDCME